MPPKVKTESTELQVFNLENLNPALLPELATFKEIQLKVVAENPFIAITDVASRDLAKKYRTALKTARTDLEKQDKLISSKFNEAKTKAKSYIAELIEYTQPGEIEQQKEIDRDEAEAEAKRQEKARLEQQRIDNIKKELEDYSAQWKTAINLMSFDSVAKVSSEFLESYTSFDTTILQEFEALFPVKVEELTQYLSDRTVSLTNTENARLENIRLEEEAAELRFEKARLEALARIAEAAEAKAKKEREDFEKEKAAFVKDKQISDRKNTLSNLGLYENIVLARLGVSGHGMLMNMLHNGSDMDFEIECDVVIKNIARLDAKIAKDSEVIEAVIVPETIQPEKAEIPEILVPEIPTVNVCTSEEIKNIVVIDAEIVSAKPIETTWDDIANDFKTSGEKSYSVWLKKNYNVPTKL